MRPVDDPVYVRLWLAAVVRHLTGPRGIALATLMRCRFVLVRKLKERLEAIRAAERANAYQSCLFAASARPEVSFDTGFIFADGTSAVYPIQDTGAGLIGLL